jgi:flagella basal body P-ring formation protein FlgA
MKFVKSFLIGMTLTASLAWGRAEVIFPKEAEVSNTGVISVFQVAELKEISGVAFSEIARMILIEKTELKTVTISGDEISKKLRDLVRNSTALQKINPSFRIPAEIRINIRQDGISQLEVERSLKNMILSRCDACAVDIHVKSLPKVKTQNYEINWEEDIKGGAFMIPVKESDQYSNKWITGTVKIQKTVPVARRLIRFGDRIQAEDVEMMDSNITFLKEETPQLNQVVGMIANKTLTAKSPVMLSDLKREPAAKKGQMLKALVGSDDFEISINASAEEAGFIGDVIKIKNPETQKTMSAIVVEKGLVKVQ